MKTFLTTIIFAFLSSHVVAGNSFTPRFGKTFGNECKVLIYANQNNSLFVKVNLSSDSPWTFEEFDKNRNQILNSNKFEHFSFPETFGEQSKNFIFYSIENDIYAKYQIKNLENEEFEYTEAVLFENVQLCNS